MNKDTCRLLRDIVRDVLLALVLFALCVAPVLLCGCSSRIDEGAVRPVWHGEQRAAAADLLQPQHLEALTRIVCAESWSERFPNDRGVAYDAMSQVATNYVDEDFLLDWLNESQDEIAYGDAYGLTPNEWETYVAHDQGDPLRNLGHECGHTIEFKKYNYSDHSDQTIWGDGGVVPTVQQRLRELLPSRRL